MRHVSQDLRRVLALQRRAFQRSPYPDHRSREADLEKLLQLLKGSSGEIARAISEDFGNRSVRETQLLEVFPGIEAIRFARRRLKRWMKAERRSISLWFLPGRGALIKQPLGVVGVIVPWNYPLYLAAGPLTSALAAGNRVMIKMSEVAPRFGELFAGLIRDAFPEDHVAVFNGGADVAEAFAALPFDHLLFTGSTAVGRKVMRSASENLTPVTLELGGKSPAIVARGFPMETAASRILYGKCLNAGQTCIAADYVLVPEGEETRFLAAARRAVARFYPSLDENPDFSSIVDERHFERLETHLADARGKGARIENLHPSGSLIDAERRKIAPTVILDATEEMTVLHEEIFGPLLPVVGYRSLDEAIRYVNSRPRPLALYYFDHDPARVERVLRETVSGGVTVNDTLFHIAQNDLPFGGVGPSGMGHYHGREGFETFSKRKGVFFQSRLNATGFFKPPYAKRFDTLMKLLLR